MSGLVPRSNTLFLNKRKQTTYDFLFMDRIIRESFYVGGTDLVVYQILGTYDQFKNLLSTSNPEQEFTAGTTASSVTAVEKAFDGREESYYESANPPAGVGQTTEYIIIDLGEDNERVINGFGIKAYIPGSQPITMKIEGSMNATSWAELVTIQLSDDTNWHKFSLDNTNKYRYVRFTPDSQTHENINWTVAELELYNEAGENTPCAIQDTFFLENRDKVYDRDGCTILCHYQIPEKPHDLTKFGFFITADQLEIVVSVTDAVSRLGRKIHIGDIVALPHVNDDSHDEGGEIDNAWLVDPKTPNEQDGRRYEVIDVSKAASGWDPRWRDHLIRLVCVPLKDGAQTLDITGNPDTLPASGDVPRTRDTLADLSNALHQEAAMAGELGQDLTNIGYPSDQKDYTGAYTMDAYPPNSEPYTEGNDFPGSASEGDWFRHLGWDPVKLYRFNGTRWIIFEIESRVHLDGRFTQRGTMKDILDLPTAAEDPSASSIQQTLEDRT